MTTHIPIYLSETEVGPGLPTERNYTQLCVGTLIGHIVLSDRMSFQGFPASPGIVLWRQPDDNDLPSERIAELLTYRAIQAAIAGEHGLHWELAGQAVPITGKEPPKL